MDKQEFRNPFQISIWPGHANRRRFVILLQIISSVCFTFLFSFCFYQFAAYREFILLSKCVVPNADP